MTANGERMLVAFDGSPPALAAARLAFDFAVQAGGAVRLLGVITGDDAGAHIDRLASAEESAGERRQADLRSALDYAVGVGKGLDVAVEQGVRTLADPGEAFEEILAEAGEWDATLIFMGRTSKHGPGRALLGSQTAHVLEFSSIPVVVVPAGGVGLALGREES